MISKEKIALFRTLLLTLMDECPCNDIELAFLLDKLFGRDKDYRIIAGGKMKQIADTLEMLKDIVNEGGYTTLEALIDYFNKEQAHMTRYIVGLEKMTDRDLKELARLQRQQFRDKDNLGI